MACGCRSSFDRSAKVLLTLACAMLGVNALLMLSQSRGPSMAGAQVVANAERPGNEPVGPPAQTVPTTVESLHRMATAAVETRAILARIEAKLDGEFRVRVIDMPKDNK